MRRAPPPLIALSAGGGAADLAPYGLGPAQVDDLMRRLSDRLLGAGYRLGYGGTLSVPPDQHELVAALVDVATRRGAGARQAPETWPLTNWAAWPYHRRITPAHEASLAGTCRFVRIDPPGATAEQLALPDGQVQTSPEGLALRADALSAMRLASTRAAAARVLFAGTVHGWAGWLPGLAEELLCSVQARQPVLVLGGFGGLGRVLADFLADPAAPLPEALTFAAATRSEPFASLVGLPEAAARARRSFDALAVALQELREEAHSGPALLGVPTDRWRALLHEDDPHDAVRAATEALQLALGQPASG